MNEMINKESIPTDISKNLEQLEKIIINIENEIKEIEDTKLFKEKFYKNTPKLVLDLNSKLETWKNEELSEQLWSLINDILNNYYQQIKQFLNSYSNNILMKYDNIYNVLLEFENEIKRVEYLSLIKEKNVVLVGGNGVGKSSFASYLKDSFSSNIVVIPAQKFLVFDLRIDDLHLMNQDKIKSIQKDNYIKRGRFEENDSRNYNVRMYTNDLSQLFSKFITVLVNEQIALEHKILNKSDNQTNLEEEKAKTILFKLNSLWQNLIPDIKFEIDTTHRTLIPVKSNKGYSLNAMSDGEKAMLYYISYVLLAEKGSFIVVDEPETFLNASNFNRLWDALEALRPDCKFIYISHVVDFIVSRSNTDLLWCKEFHYPDTWYIEPIDAKSSLSDEFPRELLSELLGARKPILFCEGDKSSLDYSIYSILFKDDVIVYPVGGHREVIQYTKSYNSLSGKFNGNNAMGIIDSDLMDEIDITNYKEDNIYTLKFNEIEMLLLTEEVIKDVLRYFISDTDVLTQKVKIFKDEVLKVISTSIEIISSNKSKKYIDTELSNYRINQSNSPDEMVEEVKIWFEQLNVVEKSKQFEEEINELVVKEDYERLLELCPLKNEISKGIANRYLDSKYMDKALNRIKQNETLAEIIKNKYFVDLVF